MPAVPHRITSGPWARGHRTYRPSPLHSNAYTASIGCPFACGEDHRHLCCSRASVPSRRQVVSSTAALAPDPSASSTKPSKRTPTKRADTQEQIVLSIARGPPEDVLATLSRAFASRGGNTPRDSRTARSTDANTASTAAPLPTSIDGVTKSPAASWALSRQQALEICRQVAKLRLSWGSWRLPQLVELLELLAGNCKGLAGVDEPVLVVVQFIAGCTNSAVKAPAASVQLQFAGVAYKAGVAKELPAMLPRLMTAMAALGFEGQDEWAALSRVMHTHIAQYSGAEVAALVRALEKLDAVTSAPSPPVAAAATADGGALPISGRGVGVRQLEHPAMRARLEALARDGGILGDDSAAVLLGLVDSGAPGVSMDVVAAWLRRALQSQLQLSPQGWVQLLQAVSRFSERCSDGAHEAACLLERYQPGLLAAVADGVAQLVHRLAPHELTDASLAYVRLRYLQPTYLTGMAEAVAAAIRAHQAEPRDIGMALFAVSFFGHRHPATQQLFAQAVSELAPRLRSASGASLARWTTSYAVASACGLLPGANDAGPGVQEGYAVAEGAVTEGEAASGKASGGGKKGSGRKGSGGGTSGATVERFLKDVSAALQARAEELAATPDSRHAVEFALRIWSTLQPSLAPQQLMQTLLRRPAEYRRQPVQGALEPGGAAASRPREAAAESSGRRVTISESQKDVFRKLRELGYEPRMETKVGNWSVDITIVDHRGSRMAVEVDGPYHFTTSQPPRPLGSSLARDACLRKLGYRVLALDYSKYDSRRGNLSTLEKLVDRHWGAGVQGLGAGGEAAGGARG